MVFVRSHTAEKLKTIRWFIGESHMTNEKSDDSKWLTGETLLIAGGLR